MFSNNKKSNQKKNKSEFDKDGKMYLKDGIYLHQDSDKNEFKHSHVIQLLLKALMVYLIVYGSMGYYLNSMECLYSGAFVGGAILVTCLFCVSLYTKKWWENLGYILLMIIMTYIGIRFSAYINSGFFAVINDTSDKISEFFNNNAMRTYTEQENNRYLAITIAMAYTGSVFSILINVFISRKMRYDFAFFMLVFTFLIPAYLNLTPQPIFLMMFCTGFIMCFFLRRSRHYGLSDKNKEFEVNVNKAGKTRKLRKNGEAGKNRNLRKNGEAGETRNLSGNGEAGEIRNLSGNGKAGETRNLSGNGEAGETRKLRKNGEAGETRNLNGNGEAGESHIANETIKLEYTNRSKVWLQLLIMCLVVAIGMVSVMSVSVENDKANQSKAGNAGWKKSTLNIVANVSMLGIAGLFNTYNSTGGMLNGKLGGVASIHFDYNTDLTVKMTPYTTDRLYLKTFIGEEYLPFSNQWGGTEKLKNYGDSEAKKLKKSFSKDSENYAKGIMEIENVAAAKAIYLPYYSEDIEQFIGPGDTYKYTYYPQYGVSANESGTGTSASKKEDTSNAGTSASKKEDTSNAGTSASKKEDTSNAGTSASKKEDTSNKKYLYRLVNIYLPNDNELTSKSETLSAQDKDAVSYKWRRIDNENINTISMFCVENGLWKYSQELMLDGSTDVFMGTASSGTAVMLSQNQQDMVISKLASYFQNNIPYTLNPGSTPRNEDFINYFLTKNKKGYCAHFASSAVLILRNLCIPARYVEGYVIDYEDEGQGTRVSSSKYEDYFKGRNLIADKTAVMKVNVTDANAHAWLEVYSKEEGWHPVELTPSSSEEESDNSIWTRLFKMIGNGSSSNLSDNSTSDTMSIIRKSWLSGVSAAEKVAIVLLVVFILLAIARMIIKPVRYLITYINVMRSGENEMLIYKYHKVIKQHINNYQELRAIPNYRQQITWLKDNEIVIITDEMAEKLIKTLEKAGFSAKKISAGEYKEAMEILKKIKARKHYK